MFGHKCFLRLGQLNDSSISGLYKDSYELLSCDYSFAKGTDRNGKPQTEVRGGTIKVCYPNVPRPEFMGWMLKSGKLENGAIVICDANDLPLQKILFEDGACIALEVEYAQQGKSFTSTSMTIQVNKLKIGSVELDNKWIK